MYWSIVMLFTLTSLYSNAYCHLLFDQGEAGDREIVFPEKIFPKRLKRAADNDKYDEHAMFKMKAFDKELVLDLYQNKIVASKELVVRSYGDDGNEQVQKVYMINNIPCGHPTQGTGGPYITVNLLMLKSVIYRQKLPYEHCMYQGQVQGEPNSTVILDACQGLRGLIEDDNDDFYIEPILDSPGKIDMAHRITRARKQDKTKLPFQCGRMSLSAIDQRVGAKDRSRRSLAIDPLFRPHMKAPKKTRYTEVIIVIDNHIANKYNKDTKNITRRVLMLVNAIDMIYQRINIRVILKGIEIWSAGDLVKYNSKAGTDLANFQKYREQHRDQYDADAVHMMRGQMWDDHGGMAYMTEMCKIKSTGVVGWNFWSILGPWLALAHELGHNFGFDHDADRGNCKCLTPRGCIMNTFKTRVPGFSDCNLKDLNNIDDSCLYNIPAKVVNPRCGNGIKEGDEQCDCGTKETCRLVDPCCNPKTCKLHPSSQCSNQHDGCCRQCQVAPAGTVCRKAKGECDVPETCDGISTKCPSNDHLIDGEVCFYNDVAFVGNKLKSEVKINHLPKTLKTRYIRIQPTKWDRTICMRSEVYGCGMRARLQTTPTSIKSRNSLCVEAREGICDKKDNSELQFAKTDCKNRNSKFRLVKGGLLIHHCTGNRVCAKNNYVNSGGRLVISQSCSQADALRFKREGKLLCLVNKPNLCVHPYGGVAQDEARLVLWQTNKKKDGERLGLLFIEQDCLEPLGMESGDIPNRQITASSNVKDKEPMHGRLAGFNSWCAGVVNNKQYLQIDLGKVKLVGGIGTEGTFDGKKVSEYKLYYSDNGQRWHPYTGRSKNIKNSCCMKGRCVPTKAKKQCPDPNAVDKQGCPNQNSLTCSGNGVCTANKRCHCKNGFDTANHCATVTQPRNGGWGPWSKWSKCNRVCGGGIERRHRFCNKPVPGHGGRKCLGMRVQKRACKTPNCPVANSCRHLQEIGLKKGIKYPCGVYTINPGRQGNVKTYCDMSRDGGGWTLLVTSHTNTWTAKNIRMRNKNRPRLDGDYSILGKADVVKDGIGVQGGSFEYRIEAQEFGRWGGIWKAPRSYSFVSTNNLQTNIDLVKQFDKWDYEDYGIEERMPWINGSILTTSTYTEDKKCFGTIAANIKRFYPAPWINNKEQEQHPTNIWYWMREGTYKEPTSCMDLHLMGIDKNSVKNGIHTFTTKGKLVKTYCDFTSDGGAWTLLLTSSSRLGWTKRTVLERNIETPSLNTDFSILGVSDGFIKGRHFQYKIEDGTSSWGGIFEAEPGKSLAFTQPQKNTRLVKKLSSNWDEKSSSLSKTIPYIKDDTLLLTTSSGDGSGTLVSSSPSTGTFIRRSNERPSVIRLWVREGTWRSCNEVKMKSGLNKNDSADGIYMIKRSPHQYLPVMCDMKSGPGAWTLLVTSTSNGWQKDQVKYRNIDKPSLSRDYSILGIGDEIKSLSGGKTFEYRLEANKRGHWGGIWKAPISYSFMAIKNTQTNVTLIKQFDIWLYDKWDYAIEKRMPWLGSTNGLLTTSTHSNYYEYGTIISEATRNNPAPWIRPTMINPGRIWYWINEDDCNADRLPVHGGVSSWSSWSACTPICSSTGHRTRRRSCTNPSPRCGGRSCDQASLAVEKQTCYYCPRSPIRGENNLCLQPNTADCSPSEGTQLVYTGSNYKCDSKYMYFLHGQDNTLIHQCSGKKVCSQGKAGSFIHLSDSCDPNKAKFEQTSEKGLKHLDSGLCVHPYLGSASEGVKLVTWSGCTNPIGSEKLKLDLFQLGQNANVRVLKSNKSIKKIQPPIQPKLTSQPVQATQTPKLKVKKRNPRVSPIRSYGGFCLQPLMATCSPSDGTEIIYNGTGGNNVQCDKDYQQFTFTKKGELIHTCSKMKVCPEPTYYDVQGTLWDGIPVLLKKTCSPHKVYYKRTSSNSLRYKDSRFCLHPDTNTPQSGARAMFIGTCDVTHIALDFYKLKT